MSKLQPQVGSLGHLAPYAMQEESSLGRRFPEPPHPYRSEYQRDRDRVVHARAFRRLENKTQVFHTRVSDHFRNRLTHTIEVTQISRTIGACLELNVDLCEVLALSHDIGHSPFAHVGEHVLDRLMAEQGEGFDHNLHALHVVEYFEERYADFRGLNLMFEVREGIVKHSRDYEGKSPASVDLSEYRLAEKPTLEAQLIDFADEIAYSSADLDDGLESELISLEQTLAEVPFFAGLYRKIERRYPAVTRKLKFNETLKRLIDLLVTDLVESSRRRLIEAGIKSPLEVRRHPVRLLGFSPEVESCKSQLKDFLTRALYHHPDLARGRRVAEQMVERMFRHYMECPEDLPRNHYVRLDGSPPHRVVCDYIAGMTDSFIQTRYQEVFGPIEVPAPRPG